MNLYEVLPVSSSDIKSVIEHIIYLALIYTIAKLRSILYLNEDKKSPTLLGAIITWSIFGIALENIPFIHNFNFVTKVAVTVILGWSSGELIRKLTPTFFTFIILDFLSKWFKNIQQGKNISGMYMGNYIKDTKDEKENNVSDVKDDDKVHYDDKKEGNEDELGGQIASENENSKGFRRSRKY